MNPPRSHSQGLARAPRLVGRFRLSSSAMTTRAAAWALALALVACGGSDGETVEPLADTDAGADDGSSLDEGDARTSCDEDGDGFISVTCGGNDCCDTDPDVYFGRSPRYFDKPSACGTWDYNCDGYVSRLYTGTIKRCDIIGQMECVPGDVYRWLDTEPDCGETGTFVKVCYSTCATAKEERVQECN